ncbi:hypothetical protein ONJ95_25385, partial [Salmonella enterica subsp. enterica serovar Virginia]|nr:hypothetical protein [Salmonella enterica subsp. enterica serovar Virginia]
CGFRRGYNQLHTNLEIFIRPISNTSGLAVESCFYFAPALHIRQGTLPPTPQSEKIKDDVNEQADGSV